MSNIIFEGEHLWIGNIGRLAIIFSFITSILSAVTFYFAEKKPHEKHWAQTAKLSFYVHTIAVLAIVGSLFFIIYSHYFEYHYAWQHSSRDLPVYFMISCFWEGQEGSFLLWIFWQMVIGWLIIATAKNWTNPVMFVVMLSQIALTSMLLGVKFWGLKFGSSPFELLRNVMANAPIFKMPNYLSKVKDGNGLNPLLQNYWMVIHPPTLFFGFATTVVPFAYAIAALMRKQFSEWIKPALPWALVSIMVLGAGIIMGGFWAYESLSFGGYWAWDPVENASLVPWLTLIAGMHLMLIYRATGNALQATFGFIITTFLLVLYATFLTRSGVLGNSSVHAFTDLGMSGQLLLFVLMFVWLVPLILEKKPVIFWINFGTLILLIIGILFSEKLNINKWPLIVIGSLAIISNVYYIVKYVPKSTKDDEIYTREFWMFIGSLMLGMSAFQIIATTSIPVFNNLFNLKLAPPVEIINHYNKFQMPLAIIIATLTGVAHVLKYKKNGAEGIRKIIIHFVISAVLAFALFFAFKLENYVFIALLFAAVYAVIGNASLLKPVFKCKIKLVGASVAHIGFGVLLIGVLVSSANKEVISINQSGVALNPEFDAKSNTENVYLEGGKPLKMGDYIITYESDSQQWVNTYYKVNYKKINDKNGAVDYEFNLYPNAQINPKFGLVANPDTKHYFSHDIFTYVSSVPAQKGETHFVNNKTHEVAQGDSIYLSNAVCVLKNISSNVQKEDDFDQSEILIGAEISIYTLDNEYKITPLYGIKDKSAASFDAFSEEIKTKFSFKSVNPTSKKIVIETSEVDNTGNFIIMKAIKFPWINLVWAGTIIMLIGLMLSILKRVQTAK
ncbi:MAG: cytochrome c biogenesis protein CcsA [Bacteroidia bacterium]